MHQGAGARLVVALIAVSASASSASARRRGPSRGARPAGRPGGSGSPLVRRCDRPSRSGCQRVAPVADAGDVAPGAERGRTPSITQIDCRSNHARIFRLVHVHSNGCASSRLDSSPEARTCSRMPLDPPRSPASGRVPAGVAQQLGLESGVHPVRRRRQAGPLPRGRRIGPKGTFEENHTFVFSGARASLG